MDKIDPDNDNILNDEEKIACREAFDAYDKLGYGTLEAEELQLALEELGQKPTKEELYKMINEIDHNNKGYIEYKDFYRCIAYYKKLENQKEQSDTMEAFKAIGGDPYDSEMEVDARKLIEIIKDEFKMTIDIERLINEIDHNKSNLISYEEFKSLLSK